MKFDPIIYCESVVPVNAVIAEFLKPNETIAIGINCVEHRRDKLSRILL